MLERLSRSFAVRSISGKFHSGRGYNAAAAAERGSGYNLVSGLVRFVEAHISGVYGREIGHMWGKWCGPAKP
jgi:hypothetical protein